MDKTIIVTGASRGLGAGVARQAAALGANVVLNARSEGDLQTVADAINAQVGGRALALAGDVTDPEVYARLVGEAVAKFGRVDAVVNNAGVIKPLAPVSEADHQAWAHALEINLLAPVMLVRAALLELRANGGRVINVSSGAAEHAIHGWGAYCVSKAALNHFTRMIAEEEPDVVAVSVAPGVVDTAMQQTIRQDGGSTMPADAHQRFVDYHTQGELLDPDLPGRALAVLALHAPPSMSGEYLRWNDDPVVELVKQHAPPD